MHVRTGNFAPRPRSDTGDDLGVALDKEMSAFISREFFYAIRPD
jgi:hypothetical protein